MKLLKWGFQRGEHPLCDVLISGRVNTPPAKLFRLFYGRPLEHHTLWIGTIAGLARRPPAVRTGKAHDVTLALGDGIAEPPEETLRLFRFSCSLVLARNGRGGGST